MKLQKIKHLFEIQLMLSMYLILDRFLIILDRFLIIMENCYKPNCCHLLKYSCSSFAFHIILCNHNILMHGWMDS